MTASGRRAVRLDATLRAAITGCVRVTSTNEGVRVQGPVEFPVAIAFDADMDACATELDRLYQHAGALGSRRARRDITFASRDLAAALGLAEALREALAHFAAQAADRSGVERLLSGGL